MAVTKNLRSSVCVRLVAKKECHFREPTRAAHQSWESNIYGLFYIDYITCTIYDP